MWCNKQFIQLIHYLCLLAVNIIPGFYIHFRDLYQLRELIRYRQML